MSARVRLSSPTVPVQQDRFGPGRANRQAHDDVTPSRHRIPTVHRYRSRGAAESAKLPGQIGPISLTGRSRVLMNRDHTRAPI